MNKRIELLKERKRLHKELRKVKSECWNEINSLEDFSFFNDSIDYFYRNLDEMLDTKYNEIRLIIKNCKKMKIDVSELEKAYSDAIENIAKYKGRKMYRYEKNTEGYHMIRFGDNEDEEQKICELHDKVVQAFAKLEDRYNLDDVEKLEKEIEHYYDQIENVLKSKIEKNDSLLEPYENEYLKEMVDIALEKIRKKIKFKKGYFYSIFRGVNFKWDILEGNTAGDYNNLNGEIRISKEYLENNSLDHRNYRKQKYLNQKITDILIHELIHHFTEEEFGNIAKQTHVNGDASPIFMGILLWINPNEENGYECFKEFKKTDTYNKMMACNTYDELEDLCIDLAIKTNRIIRKSYETKDRWISPEYKCFRYKEESFFTRKIAEEYLKGEDLQNFYDMNIREFCIGIDWCNFINENKIQ